MRYQLTPARKLFSVHGKCMQERAVIRAASDIIMLNQSYTITPLQCAHLCIEMIHNRPAIEKNALYFVNKTKLTCLPENKMQTGSIYERDIHENCHPHR